MIWRNILKMIVKIIILGSVISTIIALNDKPKADVDTIDSAEDYMCLTGYMTSVQSWVNANGTLVRPLAREGAVDLSYKSDALALLLRNLTEAQRRRRPVQILSMARCGLQEIPQIFSWSDNNGNPLSSTIEYVSFYGNNFKIQVGTGQQYDVLMNATLPIELMAHSVQRLTKSWSNGFADIHFPKLKELDLRDCSITALEDRTFAEMPNLESLYLGENAITFIQARAFVGLRRLIHLDLSRNFAFDENSAQKALTIESMDIFYELRNLHSLDFSFTKLTQRNTAVIRNLSPKMQRLSLCYCYVGRLRDEAFKHTSLQYLDLSGNPEVLSEPKTLHGLEGTLKVLYAEDTHLKTMEPFKNFKNLEILKLTDNEINALPRPVVQTLGNLQILDLNLNRIITWFDSSISLMPNLKILTLAHNNINLITDEMATGLAKVPYVSLASNFIICNCNARDLFELGWRNEMRISERTISNITISDLDKRLSFHTGFLDYKNLIEHRTPLVRPCHDKQCDVNLKLKFDGDLLFLDYGPKEYECLLVAERKSTGFHNFPTCNDEDRATTEDFLPKARNRLLLIIIPGILLPALAILFIFRRNLRYFLITMRNSAALSLINKNEVPDENTIFNYDVFVSYCNEDRAWVLDQLLPQVEKDSNISVCLHERDFQVGLSILENIVSCMDRSRSIMLILSQRFLLSQWCQFEMHLAQHRLLETRREDLILVLLEEIPRRLRPNTLHYLMLTKTYIIWPQTQEDRSQFWKRLKKSLVTHKLKHTDNVSLA